ncbi:hypothetical protein MPTK1_8g00900 [Marchantia polymorpha subsp. ruderalis]|uniref:Uncharacterized protein n=1 Tax=Marchantia polymorpha TaxID=3197 RepID=A0A2R6WRJ3_MARPO|nr:hypothetical protein MARPO_0064s0107 [Marchantia polymorpha]BBN18240.1 hypothetical protein Mp_8g00900 [Marchantia polymorpha subsp. ruderalis]|eukprot:PTQ36433.1 hypothetical protein MARPO_0064s0107 [Marchantia polymorpha]
MSGNPGVALSNCRRAFLPASANLPSARPSGVDHRQGRHLKSTDRLRSQIADDYCGGQIKKRCKSESPIFIHRLQIWRAPCSCPLEIDSPGFAVNEIPRMFRQIRVNPICRRGSLSTMPRRRERKQRLWHNSRLTRPASWAANRRVKRLLLTAAPVHSRTSRPSGTKCCTSYSVGTEDTVHLCWIFAVLISQVVVISRSSAGIIASVRHDHVI